MINADYVSTEDGTGIVHIAPGFGEDDAIAGKANGIPEVCPLDDECKFTKEIPDYAGIYVKDADKAIIQRLKEEGKLVHRGTIKHNYPHCWRDDSPLIYKAISTWFVRIDRIKEKMLRSNAQMSWVPEHIKEGRFGKWLENARDWAISRNRYWGCPLPIWRNKETGEAICVGSVAELEELTGQKIDDIHKHFVDKLTIRSKSGAVLTRVPEVLDCWFESGSMPYAQKHYPFENVEWFESHYPGDFIVEYIGQTRGWFYTLVVLSSALFGEPPAKNVIVNGLILAEDGQKMSKRKKNYPDPAYVINTYGADALRLFLLGSPVVRAEDLKFSEEGIKEVLRGVMLPVWNAYSFFTTYANVDHWEPPKGEVKAPENPSNPLDRWILSSLADMVSEIRDAMDTYHLQKAANRFEKFAEDLTNWYIRRSRRRFWKSQNDTDKLDAYSTLYYVLLTFAKCAAPFIPFLTEEIYRALRTEEMPESVHLCDFPEATTVRDPRLERQMESTMNAVTLGRFLRTQRNLKIRQPLSKAILVASDPEVRQMLSETADIISEELNVKQILVQESDDGLVELSAKANFKLLGPKLGPKMKSAAARIAGLSAEQIRELEKGGSYELDLGDGTTVTLTASDLSINRAEKPGVTVATDHGITLALDTELTHELILEGIAREFVSRVQNLRKEAGLEVSDRIRLHYRSADAIVREAVEHFTDYISGETLATSIAEGDDPAALRSAEEDLNGHLTKIDLAK